MKSHACATCAAAITAASTILSAIAADISPNPHQMTRIVDAETDTTISGFANNGQLRKRGAGTLTLSAPGLNGSGELVVEEGAAVLDLSAATSVPTLPASLQSKISLWLDATQNVVTDGSGLVVDWFDRRETNLETTGAHSYPFASSRHSWVTGATGGQPSLVTDGSVAAYVDFGAYSSTFADGKWLCMTNSSTSGVGYMATAEAFAVFARNPGNTATPRGVGTIFGGHHQGNNANPVWTGGSDRLYFSNQNTIADKGATRLDRNPIWSGFVPIDDTEWHLVATRLPISQSDWHYKWNILGGDRANTSGGMLLAEVVIFDSRISEFDRMRVEDYLWRKWMGARQTSVGTVAVNAGASATIDTDSDISGDLTGGGAVVKAGSGRLRIPARDFTGTLELREGSVRTDGAAFAITEGGQRLTASIASRITRSDESDGSLVVKDGTGFLKIASLPADTTLSVENGTVALAPPEAPAVQTAGCAASFPYADFEAFSARTDWSSNLQYINVGGGSGTSTEQTTDYNWIFSRVGKSGGNLVGVQKNIYNSFSSQYKAEDALGIGYDGDVSLSLAKGLARATFTLPAAGFYKAQFRVAGIGGLMDGQILIDGVQTAAFQPLSQKSFMRYEAALPWLAVGEHTFTISDNETDNGNRILFDDVKIIPVELSNSAPVSVAIANPSFELPWSNLAGALDDTAYTPTTANCTGWTMPSDSASTWVGKALRRRWYDGVTDIGSGLCTNPDEVPDGFLCAQLYGDFSLSQSVTFPSAGRYRLAFHLARRCAFWPQVVSVTVGDTVVRKVRVDHDDFRRYEAVFDIAAAGAQTLSFAGTVVTSGNAYMTGCALLDAVSCVRVSDIPASLVSNGDFEDGGTDWRIAAGAKLISAASASAWVDSIARQPLDGAEGVLFDTSAAGALRQDIAFPSAGRYELSFRMQTFDRYPDEIAKVNAFQVSLYDSATTNRLHWQAVLSDGAERVVTIPFTVTAAGTQTLEFFGDWRLAAGKGNVIVDDIAIVAAPAADRADLANYFPASASISVASGATLRLDFDGVAKVAEVRRGGRKIWGDISHETYPAWVMGRGVLHTDAPAFVLTVR
ncbi:MAG: hypothetical protein IKH04_06675 [Kiritimatiellae bacterium]|nr:hypothetical protein [Kiritimatiellia bacterium]